MNPKKLSSLAVTLSALGSVVLACGTPSLVTSGETPWTTARATPQITIGPTDETLACTHYVAPGGRDDAPGTEAQPWATFQHAANIAQPGNTICFRGGTYFVEETHLTNSGAIGAPITFIAYPGESPMLDGENNAGEVLILDQHTSYVRISGFTLRNFTIWGMELSGENRYVQLDYLSVEGGEAAIHFTHGENAESPPAEGPVEHVTLEDSVIHGSEYSALDCTPGPCNDMVIRRVEVYNTGVMGSSFYGSDGLEFARGYPVLVEDCYVHDNGGDGIDLNSRDRSGSATGVIVRRNHVVRNHLNGIKLWAGGRIENNVVWGEANSAVWAGTFTSTLEIFNNTIAYNMWDPNSERNWALVVGYPEELASPPVTLTLVNNLLAFNAVPLDGGSTGIYLGPGVTLAREQNNLYWSRDGGEITAEFVSGHDPDFTRAEIADGTWAQFSGQGQDDRTADPLFVSDNWPSVDLHLQETSPAANKGAAAGAPAEDVNGRARDAQPDIGAYEYLALSPQVYLPLVSHNHRSSVAKTLGVPSSPPVAPGTPPWMSTPLRARALHFLSTAEIAKNAETSVKSRRTRRTRLPACPPTGRAVR